MFIGHGECSWCSSVTKRSLVLIPLGAELFFLFSLPVHAVSVLNQASLGEKRILLDLVSGRKERGGWVDVENVASDILVSLS